MRTNPAQTARVCARVLTASVLIFALAPSAAEAQPDKRGVAWMAWQEGASLKRREAKTYDMPDYHFVPGLYEVTASFTPSAGDETPGESGDGEVGSFMCVTANGFGVHADGTMNTFPDRTWQVELDGALKVQFEVPAYEMVKDAKITVCNSCCRRPIGGLQYPPISAYVSVTKIKIYTPAKPNHPWFDRPDSASSKQEVDDSPPSAETAVTSSASESPAPSGDKLVGQAVELVTGIIYLGELWRDYRIVHSRYKPGGGKEGGGLAKALTCDKGVTFPAMVGFCKKGNFVGVAHVGSLLFASADGNVTGAGQVSLVFNRVGAHFRGLAQASLGWNVVQGNFGGLLQAGIANGVWGDFRGVAQIGLLNSARNFSGLAQIGLFNTAGKASLVQFGLYNDADRFIGVRLGLLINRGGDFGGIGVGTVNVFDDAGGITIAAANIVGGTATGIHVGLIMNRAHTVRGVQLGLLNFAESVKGLQIGAFNWTRALEGVQLGVFNFAGKGGLPFMVGLNAGF